MSLDKTGKGIAIAPELKARIVAAILTGEFPTDRALARCLGVSASTISRLRRHAPSYILQNESAHKQLSDPLAPQILRFIHSSFGSLNRIAEQIASGAWLLDQSARGLGTFYGAVADRAIRILSVLEAAELAGKMKARFVSRSQSE